MTDRTIELLKELQPADAEHVDAIFPLPQRTALLEGILRGAVPPCEPTVRRRWRRSHRLAASGISAVGAAASVLVATLAGSGTATAFGGWSATPTTPARGELRAAEAACRHRSPELRSTTPTVSDTRGPDSLLVYAKRGSTVTCVTGRVQLGTIVLSRAGDESLVAAGAVQPASIGLRFAADGQAFREMTGEVGTDTTNVGVVLADGSTVQATVANGWFAAWWPVDQALQSGQALSQSLSASQPQSFKVTTSSGTSTQPLTASEIQAVMQTPHPSSGTGASGTSGAPEPSAAPSVDSALIASFAVLRQPQPSPVPLPAAIAGAYTGPAQPPNPYGVNPNYAQYVAAAKTWVLPGSSGICIQGPSAGCNSTEAAVSGYFLFSTGDTYVGLAPDGNSSVTVTEASGSTQQVPVTDNVYVITGGNPSSITLRDASGATTTVGIPASGS